MAAPIKIGKHLKEADIEEIFGPYINRNGYRYAHSDDEALITQVETQYMICR
jgi:hypothetical protein